MDITTIGLKLLLTGKAVVKSSDYEWEFYYTNGKIISLYENGKMIGQSQISAVLVLPEHVSNSVEHIVDILEIERLQVLLKIPRERMHWKRNI